MKESSPYSAETSSPAGDSYVKHICRLFRAARAAGRQPRIEDYVSELGEPERSILLRELLACELSERGPEFSTSDDYRARFPEHRSLIESLFDAWASQRRPPDQKPETIRSLEQSGDFEGAGSSFQEPHADPRRRQADAGKHASLPASESRWPITVLSLWTRIRLLVRPRNRKHGLRGAEELLRCGGFALVVIAGIEPAGTETVRLSRAASEGGGDEGFGD